MYCIDCGRRIGKTARFCPYCGTDQREPDDAGVTPADEPADAATTAPLAETPAPVAAAAAVAPVAAVEEPATAPAVTAPPDAADAVAQAAVEPAAAAAAAEPRFSAIRAFFASDRNRMLAAVAALVLVVVAVGAAFAAWKYQEAVNARMAIENAKRQAIEAQAIGAFNSLMGLRSQVLSAEAQIDDEANSARDKRQEYWLDDGRRDQKIKDDKAWYKNRIAEVDRHNQEETDAHDRSYYTYYVGWTLYYGYNYTPDYWDYPDEPKTPAPVNAPSFAPEVQGTRDAVTSLSAVLASLTASAPAGELSSAGRQLLEVTRTLIDSGNHNADVLAVSVKGKTTFDTHSLDALRRRSAANQFATLNNTAIAFIKKHNLSVQNYDIAGGRDATPRDSSMLTAGGGS